MMILREVLRSASFPYPPHLFFWFSGLYSKHSGALELKATSDVEMGWYQSLTWTIALSRLRAYVVCFAISTSQFDCSLVFCNSVFLRGIPTTSISIFIEKAIVAEISVAETIKCVRMDDSRTLEGQICTVEAQSVILDRVHRYSLHQVHF